MSRRRAASQFLELVAWQIQQCRGAKSVTTKLPVVLLKDVPGVGTAGELAKVNHGFARNFLVPKKLASQRLAVENATAQSNMTQDNNNNIAQASASNTAVTGDDAYQEEREKREAARKRKQFEGIIKKLTTIPIQIRRKTEDGSKLEQGVTAEDIAAAIAKQLQIAVVADLIDMGKEVLPTVGEYRLPMKMILANGEKATLDVNILST